MSLMNQKVLKSFGDWHAPIPSGQSSLALFRPEVPSTYTFYCAPHYDKATGKGMKGMLIVE